MVQLVNHQERNRCINHTLPQNKFQQNQLFKCENENLKVIKETMEAFFYNFRRGKASNWFLKGQIICLQKYSLDGKKHHNQG